LAFGEPGYQTSVARLVAFFFAFVVATSAFARASEVAPADEYFGPFKQSILEVRNRLMRFEGETNRNLSRDLRGLDVLEVTIEDWYRRYPRDPWIPGFTHRLIAVYERAHAFNEARCVRARRLAYR
jgi:hypothetical protein